MVPQQAQRLRWEDDVDVFLWCDKGGVFDDDESILFYLSCPSSGGCASISSLRPSFASSFATALQFTDARRLFLDKLTFAFFCMLARLVPLHHLSRWITVFVLVNALLLLQHWTVCARWNYNSLIGYFGWSSYRRRTLDASSSRLMASFDAADPASSVFYRRSWVWFWPWLPEVDDIFLWVNRYALLCTCYLFTYTPIPTSALSWAHLPMRLRYIYHPLQSEIVLYISM